MKALLPKPKVWLLGFLVVILILVVMGPVQHVLVLAAIQNAVQRDFERQIVIKTMRSRVPAIEARLRELHSYELPEFLVVSVEGGSEAYLDWITQMVG